MTPPYRKISRQLLKDLEAFGAAAVRTMDGESVLRQLPSGWRVGSRIETHAVQVPRSLKAIRKAFWDMAGRREWSEEDGVVWAVTVEGVDYLALGRVLAPEAREPVATPYAWTEAEHVAV